MGRLPSRSSHPKTLFVVILASCIGLSASENQHVNKHVGIGEMTEFICGKQGSRSQNINIVVEIPAAFGAIAAPPLKEERISGGNFWYSRNMRFPIHSNHDGKSITCTIYANNVVVDRLTATYYYFEPPVIPRALSQLTFTEGERATIPCSHTSRPSATFVQWTKDSHVLNPTRDAFVGPYSAPSWTIKSVKAADAGSYQCTIGNRRFNTSSERTTLIILNAPRIITMTGGDGNYTEGDSVTLECQADTNPLPDYSWYRVAPERLKIGTGRVLKLTTTALDDGEIQCEASNVIGLNMTNKRLTVFHKPVSTYSVFIVEGKLATKVTLECPATANPAPDPSGYTWTLNNLTLKENAGRFLPLTLVDSQLGKYACTARNYLGTSNPISFNFLDPLWAQVEEPKVEAKPINALYILISSAVIITIVNLLLQMLCASLRAKYRLLEEEVIIKRDLSNFYPEFRAYEETDDD